MNCYNYYTKLKFVDHHSHFTSFGVLIAISLVLLIVKAKLVVFLAGISDYKIKPEGLV